MRSLLALSVGFFLACLAPALSTGSLAETQTTGVVPSPDAQWVSQIIHTGPGLSLHKGMFALPVTVSNEYTGSQSEAVFQISAKYCLFRSFYMGYTQQSFWQAYDKKNSSPFRETNYNPEIFYRIAPGSTRYSHFGADLGLEHESNGQRVPLSRSWNLLYAAPYFVHGDLLLHAKVWYRLPEDEKESPDSSEGDDNPDILDFLGHGEIQAYYSLFEEHLVHVSLGGNVGTGKGGIGLDYSLPVPWEAEGFLFARLWHGYGESLMDYKRSITRFGVGFMLAR